MNYIKIDENNHRLAPKISQRLKHALMGIVLGAVLVQIFYFYGAVKSGTFVPTSIVIHYDSLIFLGYLAICGILGWISGDEFLDWMNVRLEDWKFW